MSVNFRDMFSSHVFGFWANTIILLSSDHKTIERHTAHTIVSWPNPKPWQMGHTSDLMMILKRSTHILTIIIRELGKLNIHSSIYCTKIIGTIYLILNTHSTECTGQVFWMFNAFRYVFLMISSKQPLAWCIVLTLSVDVVLFCVVVSPIKQHKIKWLI